MINKLIKVDFYLKGQTSAKNPKRKPVYARVSYKSDRLVFAIKGMVCEDCDKDWSRGGFIGRGTEAKQSELFRIQKEIESYDSSHFQSAIQIKNYYLHETEVINHPSTVLEALDYGLLQKEGMSESRKSQLKSVIKSFKKFIASSPANLNWSLIKGHPNQFSVKHVNSYLDFIQHLKSSTKKEITSCVSNLISVFLKDHEEMGLNLINNPFPNMRKIEKDPSIKESALDNFLPFELIYEIEDIRHKSIIHEIYRKTVLLQIYSGLSFVDLGQSDILKVTKTIEGDAIVGKRQKSNTDFVIPIGDELNSVLISLPKLAWEPFVINNRVRTKMSNYHYHRYQKYIHETLSPLLATDKTLSSHTFRHTYGMRMLNYYRVSIHQLSKALGHSSIATTMSHYADLTTETMIKSMLECMHNVDSSKKKSLKPT